MSIPTAPSDSSDSVHPPTEPQAPPKRPSRRANTAERRATHNAVERARRETLNGRFLDLAAMLPNLAAVRRPSKSAIVNSSIALIHSQRRNRVVAAGELRLLKAENDALRQELNEWRQRANLPRVEEPPRSTDLMALLNLDEQIDDEEARRNFDIPEGSYEDNEDFGDEGDDEQLSPSTAHFAPYGSQTTAAPMSAPTLPTTQKVPVTHHQAHLAAQQQQQQAVFAQQKAAMARATQAQMAVPRMIPQQPPQQAGIYGDNFFAPEAFSLPSSVDSQHLFGASAIQNWSQKAIAAVNSLSTPPGSAHGMKASPFASTANQAFLANYGQSSGALGMFQPSFLGGPGSIGSEDDASSIGSSGHDGSHFSAGGSPELLGASPIDHPFSFAVGPTSNTASSGYQQQQQQQQQQRRPSVNIPAHAYLAAGSKQASPIQNSAQFAAMGLMM